VDSSVLLNMEGGKVIALQGQLSKLLSANIWYEPKHLG
jgi:hypothetical protein